MFNIFLGLVVGWLVGLLVASDYTLISLALVVASELAAFVVVGLLDASKKVHPNFEKIDPW